MSNFTFAERGRRWLPWQGRPATAVDFALIAAIGGVVVLGLVVRPLRPHLLASQPVLLEFLGGGLAEIGTAAAFARIGELPLWLAIVAGVAGMIKLDWLTWWAGRQWGLGMINFFTTSERVKRFAENARRFNPWVLRLAVVLAPLPGVPSPVVFALAGWTGMRLTTFLLLDAAGSLLITGLVAGLGYGLGQHAVDLVLTIDRYASMVSLMIIGFALAVPLIRKLIKRLRRKEVGRLSTGPAGTQESRPG